MAARLVTTVRATNAVKAGTHRTGVISVCRSLNASDFPAQTPPLSTKMLSACGACVWKYGSRWQQNGLRTPSTTSEIHRRGIMRR